MTRFEAVIDSPGYDPGHVPLVFDTAASAWSFLRDERDRTLFEAGLSPTGDDLARRLRERMHRVSTNPDSGAAVGMEWGNAPDTAEHTGGRYNVSYAVWAVVDPHLMAA